MDKDRIAGSIKQLVGGIKQTVDKTLGDRKTEAEGKAQRAEGRIQNVIGGLKDMARRLR